MKADTGFWFVRAALIVVCLILSGCGQHELKYFNYKDVHKIYAFGKINARLVGEYAYPKAGVTERKSPYELIFWVSINDSMRISAKCYIVLKSISLVPLDKGKAFLLKSSKNEIYFSQFQSYEATYYFKNLNLDYRDYNLNVEFQISPECLKDDKAKDVKEVILMERDYREEKLYAWQELLKN